MKPVGIFRFAPLQEPGYIAQFLDEQGIPWELIRIDAGDHVPESVNGFSGICLMGGPMSVNDPLPWVPGILGIVRDAFVQEVPMLGHCLGGQLISKGLGGRVRPNPVKERGWCELFPAQSPLAQKWLGPLAELPFTGFQWHGETFDIPMQAELISTNSYCKNQIVALGPHLAMQCHVEMTQELITTWCEHGKAANDLPTATVTVQRPEEILEQMATNLPQLRLLAQQLYGVWIQQLKK